MKKYILYIATISMLAFFMSCESDNELGFDDSTPVLNFRMTTDIASFNILAGDPEVTFTTYSENGGIDHVTVLVELFQFGSNSTTPRSVLTTIDGASITNDGHSKFSLNLSDFTNAVGVDLSDLAGGDVFTIYNIVELSNGAIYPDTVFVDTDGDGDLENVLNMEGSFVVGTSSFIAQLGFPIVCPVSSAFVGTYAVTDDQGLFAGNVTITSTGPAQRDFNGRWGDPGGFDGVGFAFDLVCGSIFVATQSIGLGCGGGSNVDVVTSATLGPGFYNDTNDSQFTINVTYSNAACFGGFDSVLTFVKQ